MIIYRIKVNQSITGTDKFWFTIKAYHVESGAVLPTWISII